LIHNRTEVNLNSDSAQGPGAVVAASFGKATGMISSPTAVAARPYRKEDLVYQVVTIVAMVTLVASIWIF